MNNTMRIFHRYLGFFLAGIMAVYAVSGIVMIFRQTDFLKSERQIEKQFEPNLTAEYLGKALRFREFKAISEDATIIAFKEGTYNKSSGLAVYKSKELPYMLSRMTQLHKATTNSPLFFLNIFFGLALLFFVVSAFWMFIPKSGIFKKGLLFAAAGVAVTLLLLFV